MSDPSRPTDDVLDPSHAGPRAPAAGRATPVRPSRGTAGLALAGLCLAVAASAGWWAERQRSARCAEQAARRAVAAFEAEAALREAEAKTEAGWRLADDPDRWQAALAEAESTLQRAEVLLAGDGASLRERARAARAAAEDAARHARLLAEVERVRLDQAARASYDPGSAAAAGFAA